MDLFTHTFSVSGVTTNILFPPLVALVISFLTSLGGISGAFLLLPFQMSVLGYTAPSVSGTNHVFNLFAIPSGVWRFIREGRMAWPLAWVIIAGTLPGVFVGYYVRVRFLPDPVTFKFFVGCVLLYIGLRLFRELTGGLRDRSAAAQALEEKFRALAAEAGERRRAGMKEAIPADATVRTTGISLAKVEYEFWGERFSFPPAGMFLLSLVVGIIGGAYGIGGGAIIAPFCVAFYQLPVYTIAGATLLGTFITSAAGAVFFSVAPAVQGAAAGPDWPLGMLFGLGGFAGIYLGARAQRFVPQRTIKTIVAMVVLLLAAMYIVQFLRS